MIGKDQDFDIEVIEGEQIEKFLFGTLIPTVHQIFKSITISEQDDCITFWYDRTPSPLIYTFARLDNITISFSLRDLERIEVASNIKNHRDKEITFVFEHAVVQLKLFHHLFRRSEHIYLSSAKRSTVRN